MDRETIEALRPAGRMRAPQDMPVDLAETAFKARRGDAPALGAMQSFAKWREAALILEQGEARKVETLCWLWRALDAATVGRVCDVAHEDTLEARRECTLCVRKRMIATCCGALAKWWGVELASAAPLGFADAREVASKVTRRIEDLPEAWRAL